MTLFRLLLATIFVVILGYTAVVVQNHGLGLLAVFFGDMAVMAWPGQFNLDFMILLALSGLWVAWRHAFSRAGVLLGVTAFFGGALFLTAYLFVASLVAKGDPKEVLLGKMRAAR